MSDHLKTYSVLIAWNDNDAEQGEFGSTVRATSAEEAEMKVRAEMWESHIENHCEPDADEDEIAESCSQYEHIDFRGNTIFGGRVLDSSYGAIWRAADLEESVRALLAVVVDMRADESCDATTCDATGILFGDVCSEAVEKAQALLAQIEKG